MFGNNNEKIEVKLYKKDKKILAFCEFFNEKFTFYFGKPSSLNLKECLVSSFEDADELAKKVPFNKSIIITKPLIELIMGQDEKGTFIKIEVYASKSNELEIACYHKDYLKYRTKIMKNIFEQERKYKCGIFQDILILGGN